MLQIRQIGCRPTKSQYCKQKTSCLQTFRCRCTVCCEGRCCATHAANDSTGMSQEFFNTMLLSTCFPQAGTHIHTHARTLARMHAQAHTHAAHARTHACSARTYNPQTHLQSLRPSNGDVPDLGWAVVRMMPEAVCLMIMTMKLMLRLTLPASFCQH